MFDKDQKQKLFPVQKLGIEYCGKSFDFWGFFFGGGDGGFCLFVCFSIYFETFILLYSAYIHLFAALQCGRR